MQINKLAPLSLLSILALAACGGGGGGTSLESFAARYASLQDTTLVSPTANVTVNALNTTARYSGVINIGTDDPLNPAGTAAYYGDLDVTVNFNAANPNDTLSGSAGNFVQYFSAIASPKTGSGVPGSLTLSGNLTGSNETLGDGISGTASGSIDNIDVGYTFDGNITGVSGNGMTLYFDGVNPEASGGVGFAVR